LEDCFVRKNSRIFGKEIRPWIDTFARGCNRATAGVLRTHLRKKKQPLFRQDNRLI